MDTQTKAVTLAVNAVPWRQALHLPIVRNP